MRYHALLVLLCGFVGATVAAPQEAVDEALRAVVLDYEETDLLRELRDAGGVRHELDYGAFRLLFFEASNDFAGLPQATPYDAPSFGGLALGPQPVALAHDASLYVLRFVGPVRDAWLDQVRATGTRVVQAVSSNAYVVRAAPEAAAGLEALAAERFEIASLHPYRVELRMSPAVRAQARAAAGVPVPITIQLLAGEELNAHRTEVEGLCERILGGYVVGPYENVFALVHPARLRALASHPSVFALEETAPIEFFGERQGQILANQIQGVGPSGPGYLDWLREQGFDETQFQDFVVHVVDSSYSISGHPDLPSERIVFEANPNNQRGLDSGHGFLDAMIIGAFNDGTGAAFQDELGFHYGLGIVPWGLVGATAIGNNPANFDPTLWEGDAYLAGARVSTNSWGQIVQRYGALSQTFDFLTRDVLPEVEGLQELLMVTAVGNAGHGGQPSTVFSPGTAKNVISCGASEGFLVGNATGNPACCSTAQQNACADDVNDIGNFSSRGPVFPQGGDGRTKPDLVGPGTFISGGVPQSNYANTTPCKRYWPPDQTLYTSSTGTSHSTPGIAGSGALVYQHFLNQGAEPPSPAMVKAVLMTTTTYLAGDFAGDTLPSNSQGMGRANLERAFDDTPRLTYDQATLFTESGERFVVSARVADPTKPVRIGLVWTDAPGATVGAPWVNDLDLRVAARHEEYLGNVFDGRVSVPGGHRDFRNNTEFVFLPPGIHGPVLVTVTARSIAGDGVPGRGDSTDQDFALFLYNAELEERYGCGLNPRASLRLAYGNPAIGAELRLGVSNPFGTQPAGSIPFVAASLAADAAFPCGTRIPGAGMSGDGELLLSLAAGDFLPPIVAGAPWPGGNHPAPVDFRLPDDAALVGHTLFLQGGFLDPTAPEGMQLGLTDGLQLRVEP